MRVSSRFEAVFDDGTGLRLEPGTPVVPLADGRFAALLDGEVLPADLASHVSHAYPPPPASFEPVIGRGWAIPSKIEVDPPARGAKQVCFERMLSLVAAWSEAPAIETTSSVFRLCAPRGAIVHQKARRGYGGFQ